MTDIELLKCAANAISLDYIECGRLDGSGDLIDRENGQIWNPLTDDGDALRLAVKLNIVIWECSQYNCALVEVRYGNASGELTEPIVDNDPYAATRRAIVRAAAEIGKQQAST